MVAIHLVSMFFSAAGRAANQTHEGRRVPTVLGTAGGRSSQANKTWKQGKFFSCGTRRPVFAFEGPSGGRMWTDECDNFGPLPGPEGCPLAWVGAPPSLPRPGHFSLAPLALYSFLSGWHISLTSPSISVGYASVAFRPLRNLSECHRGRSLPVAFRLLLLISRFRRSALRLEASANAGYDADTCQEEPPA
jgi:hypothetical protein